MQAHNAGELAERKRAACRAAASILDDLFALARHLHDHPELSGVETASARLLVQRLQAAGFQVEMGIGGLATAFVARRRLGQGPVVAFLAEYDALPEIGHGCGHNLIGAAALGAGLVTAGGADGLGGELRVIGTPAEETLGGKVVLTEAGVFDDIDAALMVHPGFEDRVLVESLACQSLEVCYRGRAAHAVAHPEKGIDALDPLLALFAARDALLRASRPGARIVGVITDGGLRPNVVPAQAVGCFSLRAATRAELETLVQQFRRRATALGEAYGAPVEIRPTDRTYSEMVTNLPLADAYRDNLRSLGIGVNDAPRQNQGSLDMGNVSYRVPSLHPFFAIVPPTVASHTPEFAEATVSPAGRDGLLRSVRALAMTALDVLGDARLRQRIAQFHARSRRGREACEEGG